ncbi:MAG: Ppx/GppA family phosphatase, partial [Proteobacteria bacterium]|nr:Ppx/GppA family phosphatase [Pseudomonadota bacterium]
MSDQQPARRAGADTPAGELTAVIDIGSNSVRLVVFQGLIRVPLTLFNERVLCGLGRSVGDHGAMDAEAMDNALSTLKRFAFLCRDMKIDTLDVVATAAVREASDGAAFIAEVKRRTGLVAKVLSGAEEAALSALGVIAGVPEAEGVIGDLGGGSLELARIGGGGSQAQ